MGYKKISDYGIIGNLHSAALVGLDCSIDWLCLPHIDSPGIFNALLDSEKGGRFTVTPAGEWDSTASYIPDTNILRTRFRTRTGVFSVTDFMPVPPTGEEELEAERHELYRLIEVTGGEAAVKVVFEPRFDYAMAVPSFRMDGGAAVASNGGELVLSVLTENSTSGTGGLSLSGISGKETGYGSI